MRIPCDKYFLATFMEHWCDDTNTFHLQMSEIKITLTNIYPTLQVLMKSTMIQRITLSMIKMEEHCYWVIGV